jgi:hypothetical protein
VHARWQAEASAMAVARRSEASACMCVARQKCQRAASAVAWPGRGAAGLSGRGCPHEMRHGGMHVEL